MLKFRNDKATIGELIERYQVLIVYHSTHSHTLHLARAIEEGVKAVLRVEAVFRPRAGILSHREGARSGRRLRNEDLEGSTRHSGLQARRSERGPGHPPGIADSLRQHDRADESAYRLDGELWLSGAMEGKPAGVFTSTASTHAGQETTCATMMFPHLHLGMLVVGVPYSTDGMIPTEARGGTPYGATAIAGPKGELAPSCRGSRHC